MRDIAVMTQGRFYDATSGLLTPDAFSFMVEHQLKNAQRTQEFLTLVVFVVEREWRELRVCGGHDPRACDECFLAHDLAGGVLRDQIAGEGAGNR